MFCYKIHWLSTYKEFCNCDQLLATAYGTARLWLLLKKIACRLNIYLSQWGGNKLGTYSDMAGPICLYNSKFVRTVVPVLYWTAQQRLWHVVIALHWRIYSVIYGDSNSLHILLSLQHTITETFLKPTTNTSQTRPQTSSRALMIEMEIVPPSGDTLLHCALVAIVVNFVGVLTHCSTMCICYIAYI